MINPTLYTALVERFGEVHVGGRGSPGVFEKPKQSRGCSYLRRTRKKNNIQYLDIKKWGETYAVDCPACDDERHRLCFSHLFGVVHNKLGAKSWFFGKPVCCYNEHCERKSERVGTSPLDGLLEELRKECRVTFDELQTQPHMDKISVWDVGPTDQTLPPDAIAINSPEVPDVVWQYVLSRGFDPHVLYDNYDVRFVPPGSLQEPMTKARVADLEKSGLSVPRFYENRLLIPIRYRRRLVGWQARRAEDRKKDPFKYLFKGGDSKSAWLYNFDQALMYQDVVIVEGITDVWAGGPQFIGGFGKGLSEEQLHALRMVFSYDGAGWYLPDGDDPQSEETARKMAARANSMGVFGHGLTVIPAKILDGSDAARFVQEKGQAELHDRLREQGVII